MLNLSILSKSYSLSLFALAISLTTSQSVRAANPSSAHSQVSGAASGYAQGLALYGQKNYAACATVLEKYIAQNPRDANAVYYCALANQQIRNFARAKQLYQYSVTAFPNSQHATLSQTALDQLSTDSSTATAKDAKDSNDKSGAADLKSQSKLSSAQASDTEAKSDSVSDKEKQDAALKKQAPTVAKDFASLPSQGRFSFERLGRHVQVTADVNGRSVPMVFDTGAPITTMNVTSFESIGGMMPTKQADGMIGGVGSGTFKSWRIPVTIRVGPITRVNFPLVVSQSTDAPSLLGQDFFSPFQFTIDDASSTISFTKNGTGKSSASQLGSGLSVPFRWKSRHMIVDAKINGKSYPCIFDTGAHGIAFSKKALKDLNIAIPADATMGRSAGIGGTTTDWRFCVDSISLGPIVKKDIEISVVEETAVEEPLIGQTFFDDYQYTVDYDRKMIQFLKR